MTDRKAADTLPAGRRAARSLGLKPVDEYGEDVGGICELTPELSEAAWRLLEANAEFNRICSSLQARLSFSTENPWPISTAYDELKAKLDRAWHLVEELEMTRCWFWSKVRKVNSIPLEVELQIFDSPDDGTLVVAWPKLLAE